jgi:hypothetical protein
MPFVLFLVPLIISCVSEEILKPADDTSADTVADADEAADADGSTDTSDSATPPADTATHGTDTADSADPNIDTGDSGGSGDTASDTGDTGDTGEAAPPVIDADGDGFTALDGDCDDTDPTIFPDADELCDEKDNDCDTEIDEDAIDAIWSYADMDADGYGDERFFDYSCTISTGYVTLSGDCDDTNATTHPDAAERCDDIDNDCDEETDEGVLYTWYADVDGDGYGDLDVVVESCDPGPGFVSSSTDCDDNDPSAHPGHYEICDGVDNDCDEAIDEDAVDATDWYPDADTDGFGSGEAMRSCTAIDGHADTDGDCNDDDASVHPDAAEICDDADTDEDCSGLADDADGSVVAATTTVWYRDADEDGHGDVLYGLARCDSPTGYVAVASDCDDDDASINPDALETCNGTDDDCDGDTDEDDATDPSTWYADTDDDGFGNPADTAHACDEPDGYVADNTDCDDTNRDVHPGATEYCNEVDDDCDSTIDEDDAADVETWFADEDEDGFGDASHRIDACMAPDGYVADDHDCNDTDGDISPGAEESCDEIDNNCDGAIDEATAVDAHTWYLDSDSDGFGDQSSPTQACSQPDGFVDDDTDCDDSDSNNYPDADEFCDGVDNDCDDEIDEVTAVDAHTWYLDSDSDGFGDQSSPTQACSQPEGFVDDDTDCDDSDSNNYPDADEFCDGVDNDCDDEIDEESVDAREWFFDEDADGVGSEESTWACAAPAGYVDSTSDCDDTDPTLGSEDDDGDCDGVPTIDDCDDTDADTPLYDQDCDGVRTPDDCDDADADVLTERRDDDGDGYTTCAYEDCDDSNPTVHPGAEDVCGDLVDNDCDDDIDEDCGLAITVEGISSDLTVYVDCEEGDHSCQAREVCSELTGEVCVHQTYDCATGTLGSWYPPSGGYIYFAYAYDLYSGYYGNICGDKSNIESYGIGTHHSGAGYGLWLRR